MKILITGANGFIGRGLIPWLRALPGVSLRASVRRGNLDIAPDVEVCVTGDLAAETRWAEALADVDVVIHLAARVHVLREAAGDPLAEFRRVNVDGTLNLARQALAAGVGRFIFVSSIQVNGTINRRPFTEQDTPNPEDSYALSKWEAECGLAALSNDSAMDIVIIRPPLVYGPCASGNFERLVAAVKKGIPLPLGLLRNRRTLIAVDNLASLIATCVEHPGAANETFLAGDAEDLSTADLVRRIGRALGKPARLLPVPVWLLWTGAALLGQRRLAAKICGSLQVDTSKARTRLGWQPPVTMADALPRALRR